MCGLIGKTNLSLVHGPGDVAVHIRRGDIGKVLRGGAHPLYSWRYIFNKEWVHAFDHVLAAIHSDEWPAKRVSKIHKPTHKQIREMTARTQRAYHLSTNGSVDVILGDSINEFKKKPIRFHVYSEGYPDEFPELLEWAQRHHHSADGAVGIRLALNGDPRHAFHGMVVSDLLMISPSSFSQLAAKYSYASQIYYWPSESCNRDKLFNATSLGCNGLREAEQPCSCKEKSPFNYLHVSRAE